MADTLLLNADGRPHSLITWKEAISKLLCGKAHLVEEYDDWEVSSPSITINVPSVLMLVKYVVFRQPVKFNRVNIYSRDEYRCQYCGLEPGQFSEKLMRELRTNDLTFDHVVPRSKGGRTSWTNIATACEPCNTWKDDRTPQEAGMKLLREPVKPKAVNHVELHLSGKSIPDAWRDYLYWTQELEQD